MEDERIVELLFARSEEAVRALTEKYGARCRKLAENILGNARDAEECVNDAYLGVWNSVPPKRPESLSAYLLGTVRNLSVARYHANRAKKRNSFYDAAIHELEECIPSGNGVEDLVLAGELAGLLNRFLETLKREDRILFVRRYWYSAARKAAEEYYDGTVFEVVRMGEKSVLETEAIFSVTVLKDGILQEPDRTIFLERQGEEWAVVNEGY